MVLGLAERRSLGWLALPRIVLGGLFLQAGARKLREGFDGAALQSQLDAWASGGQTMAFFRAHLEAYVLPWAGLVSGAVVAGELVAGISLLLGLGTRAGALIGLVLNVVYFLASGEQINLLAAPISLASLVAGGGRALGLDAAIRARRPRFFLG